MTEQTRQAGVGSVLFSVVLTCVAIPAIVLLIAGDWAWLEGWIFALWFVAMVVINMLYLYIKNPALLAERSKAPGSDNQKTWDKYLLSLVYLVAILWFVVLPLDARRFGWSPAFPLWLKVIGGLALLPALYLIERATIENTFLSTLVRIQDDRKQHVITTGVYSFVRHPLYLGCMLMMLGAPLLVGSVVGLVISLIGTGIVMYRILGEEKMLVEELEGYDAYRQKVHYRLIPFIW